MQCNVLGWYPQPKSGMIKQHIYIPTLEPNVVLLPDGEHGFERIVSHRQHRVTIETPRLRHHSILTVALNQMTN